MTEYKEIPKYRTGEEMMKDSEPSSVLEEVKREIAKKFRKQFVDLDVLRTKEDWGNLAGMVVGAEVDF